MNFSNEIFKKKFLKVVFSSKEFFCLQEFFSEIFSTEKFSKIFVGLRKEIFRVEEFFKEIFIFEEFLNVVFISQ